MLGLLRRMQLGFAPKPLAEMFPPAWQTMYIFRPATSAPHNRQLHFHLCQYILEWRKGETKELSNSEKRSLELNNICSLVQGQ